MDELSDNDPTISKLLAISEYYLHQTPPLVSESVRCLLASLTLSPPPRTEAWVRLHLGLVLYYHTNNILEARQHLDRAVLISQSAANLHNVSFEASSLVVQIMVDQRELHQAKSLLRARLEHTTRHAYWNLRLMLQLADIYLIERDEKAVLNTLDRCIDYAKQVDAAYTRLLCLLYKGAYLLTHHHYPEAGEVLNVTNALKDNYHGDNQSLIKAFYLIVQVAHLLMAGQGKNAKPHLKQLQHQVKVLNSETEPLTKQPHSLQLPDCVQWLTKEQTFIMAYLLSVMHSLQGGYTDKALSYAEKATQLISQKKEDTGVVCVLKAHILEHIISCLLLQGKTEAAGEKLQEAVSVCHSHPRLVYSHQAVLHTLLGHYALATESSDRAIQQFHTALQHTNSGDLRTLISLNLAVAYMSSPSDHSSELSQLMEALSTDTVHCQSIKSAMSYIQGLYTFTTRKLHDAKCHLRESLMLSNKHDLNKLTACALIILGQIFLSLGNTKETQDMASPAMQLAMKIPDKRLQVWAASLLADLYHTGGDYSNESAARTQMEKNSSEIKIDIAKALKAPSSKLVQWTVGEWPVVKTPKLSYHAPLLQRVETQHIPYHTPKGIRTASGSDVRQPRATPSIPDSNHRASTRIGAHVNEDGTEMMVLEHSNNGSLQSGHLTPQSFKAMELKLCDVVNSPVHVPTHTHSDSQFNTTSGKGSPLPLTKTPEIHLAKVATPTGTPPLNRTHSPAHGDHSRRTNYSLSSTPTRVTNDQSRRQPDCEQSQPHSAATNDIHSRAISMESNTFRTDRYNVSPRMPYPNAVAGLQINSTNSQQQSVTNQQPPDYHSSPSKDIGRINRQQHLSPMDLSTHLAPQPVSPGVNLATPGYHPTQSSSPNPVPQVSPHTPSPNPLSHLQQAVLPSYSSKQASPQMSARSLSPHLTHLSFGHPQSNIQHNAQTYHHSPVKIMQASPHQSSPHQLGIGAHLDDHSSQLQQMRNTQIPHVRGGAPLTQPSSLFSPQQLGSVPTMPQLNNLAHPALQQISSLSHEQAILQQQMLQQQQQQRIQAQVSQQHLFNMQAQNHSSQTPALSHSTLNMQGGLPTYYQQQMLGQQSPGQLAHLNMLQKLGQESNQSPIRNPVGMPVLHAYRPQSSQQLQLMNGGNISAATVQGGGMYIPQAPQLFPFNPHQSGR